METGREVAISYTISKDVAHPTRIRSRRSSPFHNHHLHNEVEVAKLECPYKKTMRNPAIQQENIPAKRSALQPPLEMGISACDLAVNIENSQICTVCLRCRRHEVLL